MSIIWLDNVAEQIGWSITLSKTPKTCFSIIEVHLIRIIFFVFQVISASADSVTIVWLEPLGLDRSCDSHNAFHQFADTATSSHSGVRWSPQQATGMILRLSPQ